MLLKLNNEGKGQTNNKTKNDNDLISFSAHEQSTSP